MEAFITDLLNSFHSVIFLLNEKDEIYFANEQAIELYPSLTKGQSASIYGLLSIDEKRLKNALKNLRERKFFSKISFVQKNPESIKHYYELDAQLIQSEKGKVEILIQVQDQTEFKLFEKEQLQREKMASLGQLTSSFAHEIKNPLTGIRLGLDTLKERIGEEDILDSVLSDLKRLEQILSQLLDFARVREKQKSELDLNELIEKSIFLLRKQAETEGIRIETDFSDILPRVFADSDQIQQVLVNIVLNAIQASQDGGLILIKSYNYSRNEILGVMISIEDDGVGIAEEDMHKINSLFFTTKKDGSGLGLAMSQKIIREHGGSLLFESKETVGSSFKIFLPVEI